MLEIPVPARYFEVPVIVQVNLVDEVAQYRVTRFRVVEVGIGVFLEERFNAALILGHASTSCTSAVQSTNAASSAVPVTRSLLGFVVSLTMTPLSVGGPMARRRYPPRGHRERAVPPRRRQTRAVSSLSSWGFALPAP